MSVCVLNAAEKAGVHRVSMGAFVATHKTKDGPTLRAAGRAIAAEQAGDYDAAEAAHVKAAERHEELGDAEVSSEGMSADERRAHRTAGRMHRDAAAATALAAGMAEAPAENAAGDLAAFSRWLSRGPAAGAGLLAANGAGLPAGDPDDGLPLPRWDWRAIAESHSGRGAARRDPVANADAARPGEWLQPLPWGGFIGDGGRYVDGPHPDFSPVDNAPAAAYPPLTANDAGGDDGLPLPTWDWKAIAADRRRNNL